MRYIWAFKVSYKENGDSRANRIFRNEAGDSLINVETCVTVKAG